VQCNDSSLYTGITTNISRRIQQHNRELPGGAKYTAARNPVELLYHREYIDRSLACIEESRIKKLTKFQKIQMIIHCV
jgi:putative endonuclease